LPLFELLKYFHGPLEIIGTMGIPALVGGYLFLLPLLDRKPGTALGPRVKLLAPLFLGGVTVVLLTLSAIRSDRADAKFQAARKLADERAAVAITIAKAGVPVEGPLEMMRRDPELRGREIFAKSCASCHVLGELGNAEKSTAPHLDSWGTEAWVLAMLHDPDAPERFGRTPYKGEMPSMDTPPKDDEGSFKPMPRADMEAAAAFLASQGDEPKDPLPPNALRKDPARVKRGEEIVKKRCTACHLFNGEGDDSGTENAPELSGYGSPAWTRAQIANPGSPATYRPKALDPGLKGHMPRFEEELAPADVELVARWVRAHARGVPIAKP
jgi:ubiquinol-cytochrome c reductase cytochrome b subunit